MNSTGILQFTDTVATELVEGILHWQQGIHGDKQCRVIRPIRVPLLFTVSHENKGWPFGGCQNSEADQ